MTKSRLGLLPIELREDILEICVTEGWLIDRQMAEQVREKLMAERGPLVVEHNKQTYELEFGSVQSLIRFVRLLTMCDRQAMRALM